MIRSLHIIPLGGRQSPWIRGDSMTAINTQKLTLVVMRFEKTKTILTQPISDPLTENLEERAQTSEPEAHHRGVGLVL
jgi:hypothetical protein